MLLLFVHVCLHVFNMHQVQGSACGSQKVASECLEWELQVVMSCHVGAGNWTWVLWMNHSALNCRAISPALAVHFQISWPVTSLVTMNTDDTEPSSLQSVHTVQSTQRKYKLMTLNSGHPASTHLLIRLISLSDQVKCPVTSVLLGMDISLCKSRKSPDYENCDPRLMLASQQPSWYHWCQRRKSPRRYIKQMS